MQLPKMLAIFLTFYANRGKHIQKARTKNVYIYLRTEYFTKNSTT